MNEVINAGAAVGATFADLVACGARPVAVGALLVLGDWTARFTATHQLAHGSPTRVGGRKELCS